MILAFFVVLALSATPFDREPKTDPHTQVDSDTLRARMLIDSARQLWNTNREKADSLAYEAFIFAARAKDTRLKLLSSLLIASASRYNAPRKSYQWADSALSYAKIVSDKTRQGDAYRLRAMAAATLNKFEQALADYFSSRKCFEVSHDTARLIDTYLNISLLYHNEIKDYALGKKYAFEGLELIEKSGIKHRLWYINNAIAINFDDVGEWNKALEFHRRNVNSGVDSSLLLSTHNNIGNTLLKSGKLTQALQHFQESLKITNLAGDPFTRNYDYATVYTNMSTAYSMAGDLKREKIYRDSALHYAHLSNESEKIQDAYLDAYRNTTRSGDHKNASRYLYRYMQLKDSVYSRERARAISDFEVQYETQKKESEIALLKADSEIKNLQVADARKLTTLIATGSLLAFAVIVIVVMRRSQRERLRKAKDKATFQREQFSALLEGEEKERRRIAKELHDGIGQLLSVAKLSLTGVEVNRETEHVLNNAIQNVDDATTEVRNISHNLMPAVLASLGLEAALRDLVERINRSEQLVVELKMPPFQRRLDGTAEIHLYRIVQELCQNIIRHANANRVIISITQDDQGGLRLAIKNDGIRMDPQVIVNSKGLGWRNILSRIELLKGKIALLPGDEWNLTEIEIMP